MGVWGVCEGCWGVCDKTPTSRCRMKHELKTYRMSEAGINGEDVIYFNVNFSNTEITKI